MEMECGDGLGSKRSSRELVEDERDDELQTREMPWSRPASMSLRARCRGSVTVEASTIQSGGWRQRRKHAKFTNEEDCGDAKGQAFPTFHDSTNSKTDNRSRTCGATARRYLQSLWTSQFGDSEGTTTGRTTTLFRGGLRLDGVAEAAT